MAAKSLDLRYPPLRDYLIICEKSSRNHFEGTVLEFSAKHAHKNFIEMEMAILKTLGNSFIPEKCLYTSYVRMAAMGAGIPF